jgi:hypothetical protein
MTTQELIDLFRGYAAEGYLAAVVRDAITKLEGAASVKVVLGEVQSRDSLLHTYEGRLRRSQMRRTAIPGLPETVESFKRVTGDMRGGYAETGDGLIYFWTEEDGGLVGCVMKPSADDEAPSLRR